MGEDPYTWPDLDPWPDVTALVEAANKRPKPVPDDSPPPF